MRYGMEPDPERPGGFRIRPERASEGSGRAGEPEQGPMGPIAPDRYRCSNCDEAIATERVIRIEAERGRGPGNAVTGRGTTGYMLITHVCPCSPLAMTSRRYRSYKAFVAMFGRGVNLPYESPFQPALVAEDDPALLAWRWELEQTVDVEDFLYWLEHHRRA